MCVDVCLRACGLFKVKFVRGSEAQQQRGFKELIRSHPVDLQPGDTQQGGGGAGGGTQSVCVRKVRGQDGVGQVG